MTEGGYPIPGATHRTEQIVQRSRFITTLTHTPSVDAARACIEDVRAGFPEATHNCWAYVAGPPGSTAHIGFSDAGEPHGTAGRPMLDVLLHSGIGEIAAVVTRYYGGTRLGKGGLVRAYGGAVQHALATLPTTMRIERALLDIRVGYTDVDVLRRLLDAADAEVVAAEYGAAVEFRAAVPAFGIAALRAALSDATSGRAVVEPVLTG